MNMKQRLMITAGLCVGFTLALSAQKTVRSLNDGWSFRYPDREEWTSVAIPHTYNSDAYQTKNYYKGPGEYLLDLRMPEIDSTRRYFLKFDAANKASELRVNGSAPMTHAGGYSSFCYDVTPLVREGDNEIRMFVDNSRRDVAPLSADFTFWGGIYRDVWLISTELQHFDLCDNASAGVYVTPVNVSAEKASLKVKSRLVNDDSRRADVKLLVSLLDESGNQVVGESRKVRLPGAGTTVVESFFPEIKNPKLWTPETPTLYSLSVSLVDVRSGKKLDETEIPVGFRWFSFDGSEGFKLNGKPYKLRGINRHQDLAPLGVALDDEAHRRDMRLLKDLGCNFVRLAHYQQDDAVLDECDRLGLIVWEEIPVVNMVPDEEGFDDNCEKNLVEMIRQHYNHPSVMMWGYMNEILLRAPSDNSPEWPGAESRILGLAGRLESRLKEEDPSRASVMAFHGTDRYNKIGLGITDVQGWNLYQGWYGGDLSGFERFLEEQHSRYPERSLIVSEWGAGSDARLHSIKPVPFDFSIEYQQKYIEHYLPYMEKSDYISGGAYWNFIDFNVAERQESMPRVNNKGLFYNNRQPKDVAYYFKSMWRQDVPVVHIAVRDRGPVVCPEDSATLIKVYSNCPEVELSVNGVSQGSRQTDNCHALFEVKLPVGVSTLNAQGKLGDKTGKDATTITSETLPDIARGETLAINVGSDCDFTSSVNAQTWLADRPYEAGKWGYLNGRRRSTTSEIFNTHDTPLYQTMLEGVTDYRIDAPAGRYEVELLLTDINKSGDNSPYLLGRDSSAGADGNNLARMTVEICGKVVDDGFAPSESGGFQHAVRRKYIVENPGESIVIRLTPVSGSTLLSGLSVRKI